MDEKYSITIQWSEKDQVFIASIPEIEGLNAFGDTPEEAVKELGKVKKLFLEVMRAEGDDTPEPSLFTQHSGQLRIRIPKSLHTSLSNEALKDGVSLNTYIINLLTERNAFKKVHRAIEDLKSTSKHEAIASLQGSKQFDPSKHVYTTMVDSLTKGHVKMTGMPAGDAHFYFKSN